MSDAQAPWSDADHERWQRLETHDFGTAGCALTFARRLARDHGWDQDHADGAVREYKRFCFLAAVAGHPVTPSDVVDEVWHQHLTYSRDYWRHFCPDVLGTDLHHEPTRGGREQGRLHYDQYAETLASYQHWFGPPPEAYWPGALAQTRRPARYRRVDVARHWVLPRPSLPRRSALRVAAAALLLSVAPLLQALPLNPLDFDGSTFLAFFIALIALAGVIVYLVRRHLYVDDGTTASLDTWSAAYLAGGPQRVVDAAVASLIANGRAKWNRRKHRVDITRANTDAGYPLDEIVRAAAVDGRLRRIVKRVDPQLRRIRDALRARGLLLGSGQRWLFGLYCALPFAAVTALGIAKISIGIARDRPVGFLMLLTFLTGAATVMLLTSRPERSRAGQRTLGELERRHAHARRAPRDSDIAIAVALAGTAVLAGTAYADFHEFRTPSSGSTGSSSDSSSDSDSCSSDSGGSGCGGCGGGGGD